MNAETFSSSKSTPPSYWKRVAAQVGVVLLVYVVVAYLVVPQLWKTYIKHRPSFDDNPRLTKTSDGHPGDAINVVLIGTENQLITIMQAAKWHLADQLGVRNDLRIGVDTVLKRSYDKAPVSKLYLFGRAEDLAFEQPVGSDPRHRHHVRFWRSNKTDQGRPIWVGAATFDKRVGLSHTTGQITHHTAADIDTERSHVIGTLQQTNDLDETYKVASFHTQREGKNGGGDRWFTDGALAVGVIKENFAGETDSASESVTTRIHFESPVTESELQADRRVLQSSSMHLDAIVTEMQELAKSAPWRANGYFDAGQQDQVENLLFRFLACRHALRELVDHSRDNNTRFPRDEAKAKSSAIAFNAGFHLILADASLVKAFRGDSVAIAKLNEEFYRSGIPAKTYNHTLFGVTNTNQLKSLHNAFLLYTEGLETPGSSLAGIVQEDSFYRELVKNTIATATSTEAMVQALVETESLFLPTFDNQIRHTEAAKLLSTFETKSKSLLYVARAHLFKGVSRLKNPEAHLIKFSTDQKRQIIDSLQPGDIILTYTAGYMSDIFIPGAFEHAITYVGSVKDRQNAGLTEDHLTWVPKSERDHLLEAILTTRINSGEEADVVEAVGEGVIFNHLGHIMETHINRLVVLRPQVSREERTNALANVFRFLGDGYDFKFDFADASEQVCTEVVYRAFDGKGLIKFTLVKRAGHSTLSADDIVNNYLASPGKAFEFVLFADESPESNEHQARVLIGDSGITRLTELMSAQKENIK